MRAFYLHLNLIIYYLDGNRCYERVLSYYPNKSVVLDIRGLYNLLINKFN